MSGKNRNKIRADYEPKQKMLSNDPELNRDRIIKNISMWELTIPSEYRGLKYSPELAKIIKKNPKAIFYTVSNNQKIFYNDTKIYSLLKHLVNSGVSPSNIVEVSMDEVSNRIRGWGEDRVYLNKIFSRDTEVIIVRGIHNPLNSNNAININMFWRKLLTLFMTSKKLKIVLHLDIPVKEWALMGGSKKGDDSNKEIETGPFTNSISLDDL